MRFAIFSLLAFGCSGPIQVLVERKAELQSSDTYSWSESLEDYKDDDPRARFHAALRAAIAQELAKKGYAPAEAPDAPDLRVRYSIESEPELPPTAADRSGASASRQARKWSVRETSSNVPYRIGPLVLDVFNAQTGSLVWRGSSRVIAEPDQATRALLRAARQVAQRIPIKWY